MFGCSDAGADGVVFALQTNLLASGVSGGGIGYQTISPSLAVEFDTYQNGWDPTYDHIAVISNGDVDHTTANNLAGPVAALASSGNIEDRLYHDVRIQWTSATNTLNIWLDGSLRLRIIRAISSRTCSAATRRCTGVLPRVPAAR